jgi:hypothetical protein
LRLAAPYELLECLNEQVIARQAQQCGLTPRSS